MIIQSKFIRAALVCAAKNDIRYYLCGVHITPKYIEATNGYVALRMEHGIRTRKNIIVQFEGSVPVKASSGFFLMKTVISGKSKHVLRAYKTAQREAAR